MKKITLSILLLCLQYAIQSQAAIQFDEVTSSAGFTYRGESWGASWGDLNGDGWPDLFTSNHRNTNSLYQNNKDGTFTELAPDVNQSGTWVPYSDTHGAAWVDLDRDGDQDLHVTAGPSWDNQLLINTNGLLFDEAVSRNISVPLAAGRMPVYLDYNDDGWLDLILAQQGNTQTYTQQGYTFSITTGQTGLSCYYTMYGLLLDLNMNDRMEVICPALNYNPDQVYDTSTLPWTDVTATLPRVNIVLDTAIADFDNNLRSDMFHVRGVQFLSQALQSGSNSLEAQISTSPTQQKGFRFRTNGAMSIKLHWTQLQLYQIRVGSAGVQPTDPSFIFPPGTITFTLDKANTQFWGIQAHDPNTDKGIYIGYDPGTDLWTFESSPGGIWHYAYYLINTSEPVSNVSDVYNKWDGENLTPPAIQFNTASGFQDRTTSSGLNQAVSCSSAAAGDFDNDMDVDLYVACRGGVENIRNRLYENLGNGTFAEVANAGGAEGVIGIGVQYGASESVAIADYDLDGFLDLFVTNGNNLEPFYSGGPLQMFRNRGNANYWIEFDLKGVTSNADGIGAKVYATAGGVTQLREQNGGYHRWSQNHQRTHFGLGSNTQVDLRIVWPNGNQDIINNVQANQVYRITEGGAIEVISGGNVSPALSISNATVSEGDASADFTVTLSPASVQTVTVDIASANGSAIAPDDYAAQPLTTLSFTPGQTSQTVSVSIVDDGLIEGTESFSMLLSSAVNATISDNTGVATILDNEASSCGAPSYDPAVDSAIFLWQDCGTGQWFLRATAGAAGFVQYNGAITSNLGFSSVVPVNLEANDIVDTSDPVQVSFSLQMWSPWDDGFDFQLPGGANTCLSVQAPSGATVLVGAGRTAINTPFNLETLGPCIAPPSSSLSISDITVSEGDASADFTVTLSPASAQTVTVEIASANGSAIAPDDYAAQPLTTLSFTPGQTSQTVSVSIVDDSLIEGTESFSMLLSNAVNATISDNTGVATILDNDASSCGAPSYDPAVDSAIFLWQNCGTGQWFLRATAGAAGNTQYIGDLSSDQAFISVTPIDLETGDVLDTTNPNIINFNLQMWSPWEDGFDFSYPVNTNVCFSMQSPSGATIQVGAGRTAIATPFDLTTLGACI